VSARDGEAHGLRENREEFLTGHGVERRVRAPMRAAVAAITIALAFATADASPPSKAACTVACQADIAACAATGRLARCRRQLVRRCRRRGLSACGATTTTSTTATSTTIPGPVGLSGAWVFDGRVFSDDCGGASASLTASLTVVQSGDAVQVTFVDDMEVGSGDVTGAGWSAQSHLCPTTSICFEDEITAAPGDPADATFVVRVLYDDGTSCQREWHGTVRRAS
jgi:hypothetical protein